MAKHEDGFLPRFLQLLEKQQRLLIIAQTPLCQMKENLSTYAQPPAKGSATDQYFQNK